MQHGLDLQYIAFTHVLLMRLRQSLPIFSLQTLRYTLTLTINRNPNPKPNPNPNPKNYQPECMALLTKLF